MKTQLLFLSVLLLFCECRREKADYIPSVDLERAIEKPMPVDLSEYAESIEYVKLETTNKCRLAYTHSIFVNNNYIIAMSGHQIYLFDRTNGSFIREIGHFGEDPGGYARTLFVSSYNEYYNTVSVAGWTQEIIDYSLEGDIVNVIQKPTYHYVESYSRLNDSIYVGYVNNLTGNEKLRLIVFSENDTSIKQFYNSRTFPDRGSVVSYGVQGWFYLNEGKTNFFELFTDTIYHVTKDSLIPRFALNMGDFAPPYDRQNDIIFSRKEEQNCIMVQKIYEAPRYLFIKFSYQQKNFLAVYNKISFETKISDLENDLHAQICNDIDDFCPFDLSTVSKSNELVGFVDAFKIKEWFEKNPEKAGKLPQRLSEFSNIKEEENPVVMIAKLK